MGRQAGTLDERDDARGESVRAVRERIVGEYLTQLGQEDALAAHLRARIAAVQPTQENALATRARLAEELAALYVRMLQAAQARGDEPVRRELEQRAAALLEAVPQADSFELRLDLAKASYLPIEERAERARLRMLSEGEQTQALRELRASAELFGQLAGKLQTRVAAIEAQERTAGADSQDRLRVLLGEARQLRAIARYYEGWARHYVALLSGDRSEAAASLLAFGTLLNAVPGKPPSVERFSTGNLRFEHICRSVMGASMAHAMLDNDVDALRWFELLEQSSDVPQGVREQMFSRKLIVLAGTERWADAAVLVRLARSESKRQQAGIAGAGGTGVLTPVEARLLGVLSLDYLRDANVQRRATLDSVASDLAQTALGDLIAQQLAGQVVDLVRRYGTLPLGESGFIVLYVKGTQAFEAAREAHRAKESAGGATASELADKPTPDVAVANSYRDAARLLAGARSSEDATRFPREQAPAALREGLALYYAGDLARAAEVFEQAVALAGEQGVRGEAMWYAIVCLEELLKTDVGDASALRTRHERLVTLYIAEFAGSENATRLLLRRAGAEGAGDERTIELLLAVPSDSALYEAARSQAARLLYRAFRSSGASTREFAALRLSDVAEELLRRDLVRALSEARDTPAQRQAARAAAESVGLRARQLAEALLSVQVPDLVRVESALTSLEQAAFANDLDTSAFAAELLFRKLQVALVRDDEARATLLGDELRGKGGPFASAADALWLRRAVSRWQQSPSSPELARSVVVVGTRLMDAKGTQAGLASQAREWTAAAAASLWETSQDQAMRDSALAIDGAAFESGVRTYAMLRRIARLSEGAGKWQASLDAWLEIVASFDPPAEQWYEARLASLSVLLRIDVAQAKVALDQTKVLHSKPFPAPWDAQLARFELELEAAIAKGAAPAAPTPKTGGAGKGTP